MLQEKHKLSSLNLDNTWCLKAKHTQFRSRMVESYLARDKNGRANFFWSSTVERYLARVENGRAHFFGRALD